MEHTASGTIRSGHTEPLAKLDIKHAPLLDYLRGAFHTAFCLCRRRHRVGVVVFSHYRKITSAFLAGGTGNRHALWIVARYLSELPMEVADIPSDRHRQDS